MSLRNFTRKFSKMNAVITFKLDPEQVLRNKQLLQAKKIFKNMLFWIIFISHSGREINKTSKHNYKTLNDYLKRGSIKLLDFMLENREDFEIALKNEDDSDDSSSLFDARNNCTDIIFELFPVVNCFHIDDRDEILEILLGGYKKIFSEGPAHKIISIKVPLETTITLRDRQLFAAKKIFNTLLDWIEEHGGDVNKFKTNNYLEKGSNKLLDFILENKDDFEIALENGGDEEAIFPNARNICSDIIYELFPVSFFEDDKDDMLVTLIKEYKKFREIIIA